MKTIVIKNTDELVVIDWSNDIAFGQLIIVYDGKGGFNINSEYLNFSTVLEILKHVNL